MSNEESEDKKNERILSNGQVLFEENDEGGQLFYIVSGNIRIYKVDNGSEVVLANMREGEVIGTMSLLSGQRRTANAKSVGISRVKAFNAKNLTGNLVNGEVPAWYQTILKDILGRFSILEQNYLKALAEIDRLKDQL